jgi:hypothetical protein
MAGVKVTDLTTLATADPTDVMYIVDTSSNTSKQIEVQNIYDGLPQFASGVYQPVLSLINGSANLGIIGSDAYYSKLGDYVNIFCPIRVEFSADNFANFKMNLPIPSNFTNSFQAQGALVLREAQTTGGAVVKNLIGTVGEAEIEFTIETENTNNEVYEFNAIINYIIIP